MKKVFYLLLAFSLAAVTQIQADDSTIEEVAVTASLIDELSTHAENPIHVVSGDDLSNEATQSLGEALDGLLGVQSADFGAAVGQPIIRGLSGNRVKILNNGMVVRDVGGIGADHTLEVDLNNVQQIEIIRGPSSLLYTNGSIGGIVNVVDNTIARSDFDQMEFKFGAEGQSVNDGEAYDFSYQNNIGGLNISLIHKTHNFGNFDTPAGAILHSDEEHEGEEEHEDEEEHGHEEDRGFVANSDFESKATRFGVSKVGDWGYFGVSVNKSDSVYGIPFHQEPAGAHGHGDEHDDEHGDEHGDEHDDEH
ncbi:MAG: TonB-dependent receptor, partial [Gammaproteobacteria bacterium]|nr:TonB-dependent receptor [Gammaproteobacteria bacterium]